MKKITVISAILLLISGTAIFSFAQTSPAAVAKKNKVKTEAITGKIVAIDMAKGTIVVKEGKADIEKTINVDAKIISSLRENEEVKVLIREGSNNALSVKEIYKKTASTKK